jgi:cytochrome oxidase Cu insertion factor (SCO1/SenC/PrrC family)
MRNDTIVAENTRSSLAKTLFGALAVLSAATVFFTWALTWKTGPARLDAGPPLPIIAQVPDFSLTERSGRQVALADLAGKIWVADFIFTRCSGPCPELSAKVRAMQYALVDQPDVKLVSICLDPENDTPAALVDYAKRFNADNDRWWFLTGTDEKYVHGLVEKGFLQSVVPETGGSALMHSTYFLVIDGAGRIRAAHNGVETDAKDNILRDIHKLLAETAGA